MGKKYFNPPTPCGVGPYIVHEASMARNFNPPTPCGVGLGCFFTQSHSFVFQSTHPVRGGTDDDDNFYCARGISIHPPRAGWDASCFCMRSRRQISIHPPRAGWDLIYNWTTDKSKIISIHPPRAGWDTPAALFVNNYFISIHPPRAGWDSKHIQNSTFYIRQK